MRPDKLLISGLKVLGSTSSNFFSEEKNEAKSSGQLSFIGEQKINKVDLQLFSYNKDVFEKKDKLTDFEFFKNLDKDQSYWLNFHGLHEVELFQNLGQSIDLDSITLRQILDTTLRPKVEEYDHYLFFSIKSVFLSNEAALEVEQLSFVLGENYVISFQEQVGDHFDHIRNKIMEKLGLVRKRSVDFLLYQLLDAVLDNYFETIEAINRNIKALEKSIIDDPKQDSLIGLEHLKQQAEVIKKSLTPFKDSLRTIQNRETAFIAKENQKYYQDLTNNCLSAIEEVDATSKSLEGWTNIYFSSLSQKMNETMKVLTTVATIFIPLTFIAGIYGMNFEYMPELKYKNGYFVTWGVMVLMSLLMLLYFRKRKWL